MSFKASAPGSMMLLGEYAVLHGKHALVCAVDKRMVVTITPRADDRICIHSALMGDDSTNLAGLNQPLEKPFHFILAALKQYQTRLRYGCDIDIVSDFSDKWGLGSSAAVTVATLSAVAAWLNVRVSLLELVRQGRKVVRQIQGVGSGADIAASVFGGMVAYQAEPLAVEKFSVVYPLTAVYAGFKTPTVAAIQQVNQRFAPYPCLFHKLCHGIDQCVLEGMELVRKQEWAKLGVVLNIQQGLMDALGVNSPLMHALVLGLRKLPGVLGAKISGSGLGDCVIGLGESTETAVFDCAEVGMHAIPVCMTLQGVYCEKI
ncbi:MAG: hypothetical protein A3E85_01540 [Gammaproteobacteria bacterium RIFCSPHIGHO2_12_FULL_45_12]|nr:MAG: hypothetical protein A3E85_01540 [Gammaproteobacteria bacterium RIFCSPHIGHO2_12_FULL_45_12]